MPRLLACLALPALALVSAGAPVPEAVKRGPGFYPAEVGTKWVYEQDGVVHTQEITRAEVRRDGTRLTVRVKIADEWDDTYDVGKEAVVWRTSGRFVIDQAMLQFPLKAGGSWAVEMPHQEGLKAFSGRTTVGETEEVSVPAGTFRATRVVFEATAANGRDLGTPEVYTYWYAPGVGLVRLDFAGGQRVLKSFTPGRR
ncbi:MAG: hypothetical protein K2X82_07975 [Gemmataceae bacterium]|nr:hypothetical protein [Gemmataceae bacterium]